MGKEITALTQDRLITSYEHFNHQMDSLLKAELGSLIKVKVGEFTQMNQINEVSFQIKAVMFKCRIRLVFSLHMLTHTQAQLSSRVAL